jgi:hypothetical protein
VVTRNDAPFEWLLSVPWPDGGQAALIGQSRVNSLALYLQRGQNGLEFSNGDVHTAADGLLEGLTAVICEKGGRPMAGSPRLQEHRRSCTQLISRLERIIAVQQDRLKKIGHRSGRDRSQTLRLRASMRESLAIYRQTLLQIRQSAKTLENSWALHE